MLDGCLVLKTINMYFLIIKKKIDTMRNKER